MKTQMFDERTTSRSLAHHFHIFSSFILLTTSELVSLSHSYSVLPVSFSSTLNQLHMQGGRVVQLYRIQSLGSKLSRDTVTYMLYIVTYNKIYHLLYHCPGPIPI